MTLPDPDTLRDWLAANPDQTGLREVARAFGLKAGPERRELKLMLAEMAEAGLIAPRSRRERRDLPPVTMLRVTGPDRSGDLWAEPLAEGVEARILVIPQAGDPALGAGDRILAKLRQVRDEGAEWHARLIRKIGSDAPRRVLGIYRQGPDGGRILPVAKGEGLEWRVAAADSGGAKDGELVEADETGAPRLGLPRAKVLARLGDPGAAKSVSLIAIHQHGIPDRFPDAVLAEADGLTPPDAQGRTDLTHLPLLTIDPADARDHDDAVCAAPDPAVPGGHIVWVAIADVAAHVRPGSALDAEARLRGNSTYFPDRVVPMLPERLSADLCSLMPGVGRPVIAVELTLAPDGHVSTHRFVRGWMRSRAALSYEQAQAAFDGTPDAEAAPLAADLAALHAAWTATRPQREARQPLDLDLPERRIELSPTGQVLAVAFKPRFDAHRLIEDFMILANVAAAETLIAKRTPLLLRIHEEPAPEKLDALREIAESAGFALARGQVLHTKSLNRLLEQARDSEFHELINMATLRSMTQAYYGTPLIGHFGLALRSYAHFTSPIRRYADLVVHRALVSAHKWGDDGLSGLDIERLDETAQAISEAERRSMAAERDTSDRYLAAFLSDRLGATFAGRIAGVARFGLFVKLDETGADGLIPIRSLGDEYFHHDPETQTLTGEKSRRVLGLGQRVSVKLAEAEPATGGLILELLEVEGEPIARAKSRRAPYRKGSAGKGPGKGPGKDKVIGSAKRRVERRSR
jgi:ribonuclease R